MNYFRKYITKYLIFLLPVYLLVACEEKLEIPVDGRVPMNEVFKEKNKLMGFLNSCYGFLPAPHINRASYTDEAHDADDVVSEAPFNEWYNGNVTQRNFSEISMDGNPWNTFFQGIRKCNVFLKNTTNIDLSILDVTADELKGWRAQARTLRALYYLQLIKRYGGVPILKEPVEIGANFANYERNSFSEVVAFILDDCDAALNTTDTRDFSWGGFDQQYGIMTRAVANAIKSQAVTYAVSPLWSDGTFSLEDATDITGRVLAECLANDYELFNDTPQDDVAQNAYALYFLTDPDDQRSVDKETIYQIGSKIHVWKDAGMPTNPGMMKSGPCPTQNLVDSYEMANGVAPINGYSDEEKLQPIINTQSGYDPENPYEGRDPRFYASIYYNEAMRYLDARDKKVETFKGGDEGISNDNRRQTRTGYYLRKYNKHNSTWQSSGDGWVRLFRLAELYLNFAETAYQSHGPDQPVTIGTFSMSARDAVNAVRQRAGMPDFPEGMSKQEFRKKYRNERRIELAFEEHRYFDVRRWKILNETDKYITGMEIEKSGEELSYDRFLLGERKCAEDKYLRYPILPDEVSKMNDNTGENWQNPGW